MPTKDRKQREWSQKIEKWLQSGKSARSWCRENQVVYTTFISWRTPLQCDLKSLTHLSSPSEKPFIELKDQTEPRSSITLEYKGVQIHLSDHFDGALLKRCLDLLRGILC